MHKSIYGISLLRKDGNPNINLAKNKQIVDFINERVINTKSFSESVYCYLNDMGSPPKCPVCGNGASYKSFIKGYGTYCSTRCANKDNAADQSATKKAWSDKHIADIVDKRCNTNLAKYGVSNPAQLEEIKQKIKETCLDRYGVEYSAQSITKREKTIATNLSRYGHDVPTKSDVIKDKIQKTIKEKLGSQYYTSTSQSHIPENVIAKLSDRDWLVSMHVDQNYSAYSISKLLGVDITVVHSRFVKFNIQHHPIKDTMPERMISDILKGFDISFIKRDRNILNGKELDFYIPEYNLAIEYNGLYYHSYNIIPTSKQKLRHYNKFIECENKGIHLIQYNTLDFDKLKTFIAAKIGRINKIYARKCTIDFIDHLTYKDILDRNHLQKSNTCQVKIGLSYQGQVMGVMGFSKKGDGWELSRMAFDNVQIVGGASKMLKFFRSKYNGPIVSHSSNAYSTGKVYRLLGFHLKKEYKSDLWYTNGNVLYNRQNFMKNKLSKKLNHYDDNLTEQCNMINNGYRIYYGPGTRTWVLQ